MSGGQEAFLKKVQESGSKKERGLPGRKYKRGVFNGKMHLEEEGRKGSYHEF